MPNAYLFYVACLAFAIPAFATDLASSPSGTIPCRGLLLVANKGDRALGIVDPESGAQVASIPEDGITGHEVAASADGKLAFVPIFGDSGVGKAGSDGRLIRVIDVAKRQIVGTIDFGKGVRPHCAVLASDGLLYVTAEMENAVRVIDPVSWKILATIDTGAPESHMLAITKDAKKGYTANVGSGTVSVLDLPNRKRITSIKVADRIQRISLSADDRVAFTADQGKARIAVIDTESRVIKAWIAVPGNAYGTAATPDGRWLVAALSGLRKVGIIDLQTMKLHQAIPVPPAPQEVLIRPDGAVAYVSCDSSGQVVVINLRSLAVEKVIPAGNGADGLAWAKLD
jgi:YVTN family beta-propeller protein